MRERRRARTKQVSPSHERWLLSYADFVTLLLAVFIVLFATTWKNKQTLKSVSTAIHSGFDSLGVSKSTTDLYAAPIPAQAGAVPPAHASFNSGALASELEGVLGDSIQKQEIVMQQTPDGLIISLRELGFFNSGEATLLPGASDKLKQTAQIINQHDLEVRIEGHSDNQPIHTMLFASNWELSTARATSVLNLLVEDASFPPTHISIAGYGPFRPVADNNTASGRRSNRRVDLVVIAPRSVEQPLH